MVEYWCLQPHAADLFASRLDVRVHGAPLPRGHVLAFPDEQALLESNALLALVMTAGTGLAGWDAVAITGHDPRVAPAADHREGVYVAPDGERARVAVPAWLAAHARGDGPRATRARDVLLMAQFAPEEEDTALYRAPQPAKPPREVSLDDAVAIAARFLREYGDARDWFSPTGDPDDHRLWMQHVGRSPRGEVAVMFTIGHAGLDTDPEHRALARQCVDALREAHPEVARHGVVYEVTLP